MWWPLTIRRCGLCVRPWPPLWPDARITGMTEPVTRFSGEYAFLSSFAQIPFMYNIPGFGLVQLPDREHGFQALKTDHPEQIRAVLYAGSAAGAKRQGRQVTMRPCWEQDR